MLRTKEPVKEELSEQVARHINESQDQDASATGNFGETISTGSTLLDLAISGGVKRGGGIPGGILVEIFGPASCGKTVMLCEIAGRIQNNGGDVLFFDPEARLNKQFAKLFGFDVSKVKYLTPDTISGVFGPTRKWEPNNPDKINGIFADSLAALSTEMEMDDADKYGMRRAKEFSEELRKTCRTITAKNYIMVCSNQVRENLDAGLYGQKYKSTGGLAVGFYASLRLRCSHSQKIKEKRKISGKEYSRVTGVDTDVEVFKSSIWKPFRTAPLTIRYDYGIDDVAQNLQFVKEHSHASIYTLRGERLSNSLDEACKIIERDKLERKLRAEVIRLWEEIENSFASERTRNR